MKIDLIAGARPNFVKVAALIHAKSEKNDDLIIRFIHTGQHYDDSLSGSFFTQLGLPAPNFNLNIGSGTQAEQTSAIMLAYEKILLQEMPDVCVVVGDVTSSMACAITAKKMQVRIAHVEAGIRSGDWSMPEEVNRVLIDSISDLYFTTTRQASQNLIDNGVHSNNVHFVGNTMIDTLLRYRCKFQKPPIWDRLKLQPADYLVLTLHRPNNVDEVGKLKQYLYEIAEHSQGLPVVFPVHPRTMKKLRAEHFEVKNLHFIEPLGYLSFNYLVENAKAVITDSGGITEEATVLGVPCMTLRDNTERPETISEGTNELLGTDPRSIAPALNKLFKGNWKKGRIPELWDGRTGGRILSLLQKG